MSTKIHKFTEEQLASKIIDITNILKRKALENKYIIHGIGINVQTEDPIIYYSEPNSNIFQISHVKNNNITMHKLTQDETTNYNTCVIKPGHYYHTKDESKVYSVLGLGYDHEDKRLKVIYKARYGHELTWVRDNAEWNIKFKESEYDYINNNISSKQPIFYPITLDQSDNNNNNNSYKYGFYLSFTINILLLVYIASKK